jgi:hypothetical protein
MRPQHARSRTACAPLLALACMLAGAAPVRAADAGAAEPEAAAPAAQAARKPPARDAAATFAKRLGLDAKQEVQVRRLLAIQQAQVRKLWRDPSIAADDRVGAVKAINAKTIDQIRSLLTEEQKQKYFQPKSPESPALESGRSVEDWMHALSKPQNPDANGPH